MNPFEKLRARFTSYITAEKPKANISIREAGGTSGGQITNANIKNFVAKAVGNVQDSLTQDFNAPEDDLSEIRDAINADSYIKLAVAKYSQLLFKAGYNIVSDNDAAAEYIQSRFSLMSFMTGTPIEMLFQQVGDDLVSYSNAFLIKSRAANGTGNLGGIQAKGVFNPQPVSGYFRVDPTTMQIKVDKNGTIKNYQQEIGNTKKSYKPEDVVHFYIDKEGGKLFGTPRLTAALEDVKMLRKIEGNAVKLIYRYSAPLMQMKIGLPEVGFRATDQEIKEARSEIEKLADDGIIITNEATEFNTIGAEGQALDIHKYLSYFEARVFSALSLSAAMAGRGGAKQDADSMEEQVHDAVKFYQKAIQIFVENNIINELLLEGGYNPIFNVQDRVHFAFEEISLDTKVKMQTHAMNMFQGNAIPFDEMRTRLGLRSDTVDTNLLYDNMIKHKNEMELLAAKAGVGNGAPSEKGASTPGPDKKAKTPGTASNTIQPKNQHGTSSVSIKESQGHVELAEKETPTSKNIDVYKKKFSAVYKKYCSLRNEICESDADKAFVALPLARDTIKDSLLEYTSREAEDGYIKALRDAGQSLENAPKIDSGVLNNRIEKHLTQMFKDIQKKIKAAKTKKELEAAFNSSEYRLRFLTDHVVSKAYWYAYVKTAQALKISQVAVDFSEGSDDAKNHSKVIHTNHFSLDDIPAYHPYCRCKLMMKGR